MSTIHRSTIAVSLFFLITFPPPIIILKFDRISLVNDVGNRTLVWERMVKDHTLHLKGCGFLSIPRLGNMPRKQKAAICRILRGIVLLLLLTA